MKKLMSMLLCIVAMSFVACNKDKNGLDTDDDPSASVHYFSVGDNKKVIFSKGNLQYSPGSGTWRFAEHQYDVYNRSANDNVGGNGWIDLFAWGTGRDPMFIAGYSKYKSSFTDWGVNSIDGSYHSWRTLKSDEWSYLISGRLNSQALWGLAKVNNVQGLIILPDNFESPKGLTFDSGYGDGYKTNVYTISEWESMQNAGAIFLPASSNDLKASLYYWSATQYDDDYAYILYFNGYDDLYVSDSGKYKYYSVRLVYDKLN